MGWWQLRVCVAQRACGPSRSALGPKFELYQCWALLARVVRPSEINCIVLISIWAKFRLGFDDLPYLLLTRPEALLTRQEFYWTEVRKGHAWNFPSGPGSLSYDDAPVCFEPLEELMIVSTVALPNRRHSLICLHNPSNSKPPAFYSQTQVTRFSSILLRGDPFVSNYIGRLIFLILSLITYFI